MAKLFRLWQKKRGDRRTGSRLAGSLGEAAFFGALFTLGVVALATVITTQTMNPDPHFFKPGLGSWLTLIVLATFILIGGTGFVLTVLEFGASAERRSALVRRAGDMEFIREVRQRGRDFPNIPRDANLTNSPGVRLRYRLPGLESPAWTLVAAAVTCLMCVGIATVLIAVAVRGYQIHRPQWALTAFLVPFSSVTGWSVYYFIRQLMLHTGIGPTSVEISAHPLYPGASCEIFLVQSGRLQARQLSIDFICEEQVEYRQGTDFRIERRVVYQDEIFCGQDFKIEPAIPFEQSGSFTVPKSAMHSFQSTHNTINWKIVVSGDFVKWPKLVRSFPVVVYPRECPEETPRGAAD